MQIELSQHSEHLDETEMDLKELFQILWKGRLWIAFVTLMSVGIAIFFALNQPNYYRAEMVMASVAEEKGNTIAGLAGRFGLSDLPGFNFGSSSVDKSTLGMETLKSRVFLTRFIHENNLSVPLMASKGWDKENDKWIINPEIYDEKTGRWLDQAPTDWQVYKTLRSKINITADKKTGIINLTVESLSPLYANEWASKLVADLNNYLRESDVLEARKNTVFLEKQLKNTSVAEFQSVLYQLIEQQTKTIMLAEARDGYVFRVIDPPVIPEEKAGPKRAFIVVVAALLGGMLSSLGVLLRELVYTRKR